MLGIPKQLFRGRFVSGYNSIRHTNPPAKSCLWLQQLCSSNIGQLQETVPPSKPSFQLLHHSIVDFFLVRRQNQINSPFCSPAWWIVQLQQKRDWSFCLWVKHRQDWGCLAWAGEQQPSLAGQVSWAPSHHRIDGRTDFSEGQFTVAMWNNLLFLHRQREGKWIYGAVSCSGMLNRKTPGTAIVILWPIKLYHSIKWTWEGSQSPEASTVDIRPVKCQPSKWVLGTCLAECLLIT